MLNHQLNPSCDYLYINDFCACSLDDSRRDRNIFLQLFCKGCWMSCSPKSPNQIPNKFYSRLEWSLPPLGVFSHCSPWKPPVGIPSNSMEDSFWSSPSTEDSWRAWNPERRTLHFTSRPTSWNHFSKARLRRKTARYKFQFTAYRGTIKMPARI